MKIFERMSSFDTSKDFFWYKIICFRCIVENIYSIMKGKGLKSKINLLGLFYYCIEKHSLSKRDNSCYFILGSTILIVSTHTTKALCLLHSYIRFFQEMIVEYLVIYVVMTDICITTFSMHLEFMLSINNLISISTCLYKIK